MWCSPNVWWITSCLWAVLQCWNYCIFAYFTVCLASLHFCKNLIITSTWKSYPLLTSRGATLKTFRLIKSLRQSFKVIIVSWKIHFLIWNILLQWNRMFLRPSRGLIIPIATDLYYLGILFTVQFDMIQELVGNLAEMFCLTDHSVQTILSYLLLKPGFLLWSEVWVYLCDGVQVQLQPRPNLEGSFHFRSPRYASRHKTQVKSNSPFTILNPPLPYDTPFESRVSNSELMRTLLLLQIITQSGLLHLPTESLQENGK